MIKKCPVCGESNISKFGKNKSRKDGLQCYCKSCKNIHSKSWRENNPESHKKTTANTSIERAREQYYRNYYAKNKSRIDSRIRIYREENREKISEYNRIRYIENKDEFYRESRERVLSNPEKNKEYQKNYRERHRDEINKRASERRRGSDRTKEKLARRSRENNRIFNFSIDDWNEICELFDNKCSYCRKSGKLQKDHFIPISFDSGHTVPGNIIPACGSCNSSKINKTPIEWVVSKFGVERYYEIRDIINPIIYAYEDRIRYDKRNESSPTSVEWYKSIQ